MRKLLLGTMALIGLLSAGAAQAADMPVKAAPAAAPPPFNWTGFYIGVHGGGAWGTVESTLPLGTIDSTALTLPISSHTINGFVAGGQVGYNWQVNPWLVFGIEGQFSWTDATGRTPCAPLSILGCTTDVNWIATFAGRIGYAMDRTMIYIKGGVAWADTDHTVDFLGISILSSSSTRTGAMIGAGIEHAFAPNWSAKIEYNFMDFDTDRLGFGLANGGCPEAMALSVRDRMCGRTIDADVTQKIHLIKFGLNYRFNWGSPAPVAARY
jgi:outer membrane immunogenic protein